MRINGEAIYMTDNGAALCGEHLGSSARRTGCDISGQEILEVVPALAQVSLSEFGFIPSCENCGKIARLTVNVC